MSNFFGNTPPPFHPLTNLAGQDGTTQAGFTNPLPIVDGAYTIFQGSNFRSLGYSNPSTGIVTFGVTGNVGFSYNSAIFYPKNTVIRNNSGQTLHIGWAVGNSIRGGTISSIVSGAGGALVTTSTPHGLSNGDKVRIVQSNGTLGLIACNSNYAVSALNLGTTTFSLPTVTSAGVAATAGYWFAGFTQYIMASDWSTGSEVLGGITLEHSGLQNDWFELPYQIGVLEISNGTSTRGAATGCEVYFFG